MGKIGTPRRYNRRYDVTAYLVSLELESRIESMATAMRTANLDHIAKGRMTLNMENALNEFYRWAKERQ